MKSQKHKRKVEMSAFAPPTTITGRTTNMDKSKISEGRSKECPTYNQRHQSVSGLGGRKKEMTSNNGNSGSTTVVIYGNVGTVGSLGGQNNSNMS